MYIHEPLDSLGRMLASSLVQMLETKQEDVIYLTRNRITVTQVTFITDNQKPRHLDTDEEKFKFLENFGTLYKKIEDTGYSVSLLILIFLFGVVILSGLTHLDKENNTYQSVYFPLFRVSSFYEKKQYNL